MFNALSSDELLLGVGRVLRMAADARGPLEDYERSQLLSAYSVTRLLAAEERGGPELLASTRADLLTALGHDRRPAVATARAGVEEAATGDEVGAVLVALLAALPPGDALRAPVHAALRTMVDREVELLAGAPE